MFPIGRIAARNFKPIFIRHPNEAISIVSRPLAPLRFSGSSSKKTDLDQDRSEKELIIPKEKWDPVAQKFLKLMPVEHHGIEPAKFNDYTIWYPIYKFPYLGMVRNFVRAKVYVTFISLGSCLNSLLGVLLNSVGTLGYTTGVAGLALFGMCMAGNLCRKLIVQIYVTEDLEYVRMSRFTFFARRQDIVMPKSMLKPLSESNGTHRRLVLRLETIAPPMDSVDLKYDNYEFYDEKFNIVLMFEGIHDDDKFEAILGKLLRRIY